MHNHRYIPKRVLAAFVILSVLFSITAIVYMSNLLDGVPDDLTDLQRLDPTELKLATEFFDAEGKKIGEVAQESRYYIALGAIPRHVIQAFLSAEDKDFFEHSGLNLTAILRAAWKNVTSGRLSQGASTITQQLARMYFLSSEKTFSRKIREIALALALERRFTKQEILELYLNKLFLGNGCYGIEAAARTYFHKGTQDLDVGEAAILAGLPKAPSKYAIHRNYNLAKQRQQFVLGEMYNNGYITKPQLVQWRRSKVRYFQDGRSGNPSAGYFVAAVKQQLARQFAAYPDIGKRGLKVYTTYVPSIQGASIAGVNSVGNGWKTNLSSADATDLSSEIEAASVSIDPRSGSIVAMQGGKNFRNSQFNRAVSMRRQMGDAFLPIYVAIALDRGYTLATPVDADPLASQIQTVPKSIFPTLYDILTQGDVENGVVLVAAMGVKTVESYAKRLGFRFNMYDLRMGLGRGEATPMEVARAYGSIASSGRKTLPHLIDRVVDSRGNVLFQHARDNLGTVFRSQSASIMMRALRDAARFGNARDLGALGNRFGGTIGVSSDLKNGWIVAVRPDLVTCFWIGNNWERATIGKDRNESLSRLNIIWKRYAEALPKLKDFDAPTPDDLSYFEISVEKDDGTFEKRILPFEVGTMPPGSQTRF